MAYKKTLEIGFDDALSKIPEALQGERFGVLTEIDVLQRSLDAGLPMRGNVIVYETDDDQTVVSAVDAMPTIAAQGDPAMRRWPTRSGRRCRKSWRAYRRPTPS